jgi:hypothetical protein
MFQKTELAEGGGQVRLVELRRLGFPTVTRQVKGGVAKVPWARLECILAAKQISITAEIGVGFWAFRVLFTGGKRKLETPNLIRILSSRNFAGVRNSH